VPPSGKSPAAGRIRISSSTMVHGALASDIADDRRGGAGVESRARCVFGREFFHLITSDVADRAIFRSVVSASASSLRAPGISTSRHAHHAASRRSAMFGGAASKPRARRSVHPIRREICVEDAARGALDSVLPPSVTKIRSSTPLDCNSIRLSVATFIESNAFRRHRGFDQMKARRKRAKAASSKGAAKKGPKKKKARRKKAKKK